MNNWWSLDKETMRKCKQILFPSGFSMTQDKKVYTPEISIVYSYGLEDTHPFLAENTIVEGPVGLEPTTPCLKGRCSNQLSYGPVFEYIRYYSYKIISVFDDLSIYSLDLL
jgi:hypothetical protein